MSHRHQAYRDLGAEQTQGPMRSYTAAMMLAIACPPAATEHANLAPATPHCDCPAPVVVQWPWVSKSYAFWLQQLDQALLHSVPSAYIATVFDSDLQQRVSDEAHAGSKTDDELLASLHSISASSHELLGVSDTIAELLRQQVAQTPNGKWQSVNILPYTLPATSGRNQSHRSFQQSDITFTYMASYNPTNQASLEWLCSRFVPQLGNGLGPLHILG